MKIRLGLWLGLCLCLSFPVLAQQTKSLTQKTITFEDNKKLNYWLYQPTHIEPMDQKMPMILFLHGAGERGDKLQIVLKHGPPMQIKGGKNFPAYVISPQCPQKEWWTSNNMIKQLDGLVSQTVKNLPIDINRIYITGSSMGGMGTFALSQKFPNRFAAAIPICGRGDVSKASSLVDLPMWIFHGDADSVVKPEGSKNMVEAIKKAGGKKIKLTIYPNVGHNSWTRTYDNPQVYEWLFAQQLGK